MREKYGPLQLSFPICEMLTMLRIGHRGAAGYAPENTLLGIKRAITLNANFVEVDVQQTTDGHLVLMHDKRVDRTTNGMGYVSSMNLSELRELDAGEGELIPTVEEVLAVANGQVGLMLEIITPGIAEYLYKLVRKWGFTGPVIYSSFLHAEVRDVREIDGNTMALVLLEGIPIQTTQFAIDARASYVGLAIDSVTISFVKDLHAAGLKVFTYTVNDPQEIHRAHTLGVDGIISDFPDRV